MNNSIPWSQLIAFGMGSLRLSSSQFWTMTLRELDAAMLAHKDRFAIQNSPDRLLLEQLIELYPDKIKQKPSYEK